MAWKEGGGPSGQRNAINIAVRCMQMGPPYCKWDTWARDVKFLHQVEGFHENMTKRWTLMTKAVSIKNHALLDVAESSRAAGAASSTDVKAIEHQATPDAADSPEEANANAQKAEGGPVEQTSVEPRVAKATKAAAKAAAGDSLKY
eukprot:2435791-Pyramimonas_sp.AAC.1